MATALSLGRKNPDKQNVGGLKAAYFVEFAASTFSGATLTADEITAFGTALTLYKYELRGANSYDETNNQSQENGTSFWEGSGTLQFKKQSLAAQKEIKLMAFDRKHIILEDYNGNFRLCGFENGCDISVNTASGSAMGDFNGYNVTFTTQEQHPARYVASSIIDDAVNTNVTEGSGTP